MIDRLVYWLHRLRIRRLYTCDGRLIVDIWELPCDCCRLRPLEFSAANDSWRYLARELKGRWFR